MFVRVSRRSLHRTAGLAVVCSCCVSSGALARPAGGEDRARRLTLSQALALAKRSHPSLRAGRAETAAAVAQRADAFAGYLPRVDAYAQYQRSTGNWLPSPGMAGVLRNDAVERSNRLGLADTVNYLSFGTTLAVPIYDFGRTGSQVDAAGARDSLARASLQAAEHDVDVGVRVAYYGVLAAGQAVRVADETRQNQDRHLHRIRQFVAAGSRTRYDLVSAELKLADADLAVLRAQHGLRTARVRLTSAIGLEDRAGFEVVEPPAERTDLERQRPDELVKIALARRPELARSAAQIAVRRADHRGARAGLWPELVAAGSLSGAKVDDLDAGLNWQLGVGLTWRVFEGLRTCRRSEAARALTEASEAQHQRLRQAVQLEIEVQLMAVDEARQRLQVATKAVATAREKLRLAEGRYSAGATSVLELEDAQVAHTAASFQAVQARFDLSVARVLLGRAVGR